MLISAITLLAATVTVGGGLTYVYFPQGLAMGLKSVTKLKPDSLVYTQYMNPQTETETSFFIYELKNPRGFLAGAKPKLGIRGPFVYRYTLERVNISFSQSGELVSFGTRKYPRPENEASADFEDPFYMLNPIVPSVQAVLKVMVLERVPFRRVVEPILFRGVSVLMQNFNERLVVRRTARQFLEGVTVEILAFFTNWAGWLGFKELAKVGGDNKFGIVQAPKSGASVDLIELYTGVGSTSDRFGDVAKWKGSSKLSAWNEDCSKIDGNNGELYRPMPRPGKAIKVFLSSFCRSLTLDPIGNLTKIHDDLDAYEYKFTDRIFQGVRSYGPNKCFCDDMRTYDCQLDGLMKMSPCLFGTPLYFARLDFQGADPRIRDLIDEDSLNFSLPYKQSLYFDPITGAPVRSNMSLVATFKLVRHPQLKDTSKIQNLTYFPVFASIDTYKSQPEMSRVIKMIQEINAYHKPAAAIAAASGIVGIILKLVASGL